MVERPPPYPTSARAGPSISVLTHLCAQPRVWCAPRRQDTHTKGFSASALGVTASTVNISNTSAATSAITSISSAITSLGTIQGAVGSAENRLMFAISLAQSQIVNKSAAESLIRDANMAEESSNLTRYNILNQSGLAALAQANQSIASVLGLLR